MSVLLRFNFTSFVSFLLWIWDHTYFSNPVLRERLTWFRESWHVRFEQGPRRGGDYSHPRDVSFRNFVTVISRCHMLPFFFWWWLFFLTNRTRDSSLKDGNRWSRPYVPSVVRYPDRWTLTLKTVRGTLSLGLSHLLFCPPCKLGGPLEIFVLSWGLGGDL